MFGGIGGALANYRLDGGDYALALELSFSLDGYQPKTVTAQGKDGPVTVSETLEFHNAPDTSTAQPLTEIMEAARRYAKGDLRPVYFWPNQLAGHVERTYRPGEAARTP